MQSICPSQLSRCGSFERVFPSPTCAKHRKFFETEVGIAYTIVSVLKKINVVLNCIISCQHNIDYYTLHPQRYYNALLQEYVLKYHKTPLKGMQN